MIGTSFGTLRRVLALTFKVGGVAFLLGFIGPMILAPGANQGPLLGIFVTGPLGLVFGFVAAVLREIANDWKAPPPRAHGARERIAWRMPRRSEGPEAWLRGGALFGGVGLLLYGLFSIKDNSSSRGPAAMIVVGVAVTCFGVTGNLPRWYRN